MAILDGGADTEILRVWGTIAELSDQLNQHRSFTASLHGQIDALKTQAIHSQTGFVLRRFNKDKSDEEYDAELKRMNTALSEENQALVHDNKQLGVLIKEYEQTLENIMDTFRKRAHEVQQRELTLIKDYESRLMAKESEELAQTLTSSAAVSQSIATMSQLLRQTMRSMQGEDRAFAPVGAEADDEWAEAAVADWALDRESELARLEAENTELRRLLAGHPAVRPLDEAPVSAGAPLPDMRMFIRGGFHGRGGGGGRMPSVGHPGGLGL